MTTIKVKLFGVIPLVLNKVPTKKNLFRLEKPKSDISKQSILAKLTDQLGLSANVVSYLPSSITLENLSYNTATMPAKVLFSMKIDLQSALQVFPKALQTEKVLIDITTDAKIIEVEKTI